MALTTIKTAAIADDAVTTDKLANAINTERTANTAKTSLEDNSVTLAKMAGGTDGQIITYDASGDPVAVGPGTDGQVLTSTGAGSPPAFETIVSSDTLSFRNLIINGAFQIAQRGTSSTSQGIKTVDRWQYGGGGFDENPTQAQHALTSSDTGPWGKGFRYSYHLTNGNQTGGAGAADYMDIQHRIEAQDIAQSGWDYTSASSYITLSFWVRSSVAQNFYGYLRSRDGTNQRYGFETGSLSADTWTKITKTIPGNSNIQFDNNNAEGLRVVFSTFLGTDYTASGTNLNTWEAYSSSTITPDQTSTWWTTNDATFEITGVQLEPGSTATEFEHRSHGDEERRCCRYYRTILSNDGLFLPSVRTTSAGQYRFYTFTFPEMRDAPTATGTFETDTTYQSGFPSMSRITKNNAQALGHLDSDGLAYMDLLVLESEL